MDSLTDHAADVDGLVYGSRPERTPKVSFEFFPPKTEKMAESLWRSATLLAGMQPEFVSVTYGAGGSTRERTHDTVTRLQDELGLTAAAHLTCVAATREEIDTVADRYWDNGIRHIVALRGDPPSGIGGAYEPHPGGYAYTNELVQGLLARHPFEISVAAFPEVHPEAVSAQADIDFLKRKIDSGATRAITQFFFDNDCFLRFRDAAAAAGITAPIVPGILPISNFTRTVSFAEACKASIPPWLAQLFEGLDDTPETRNLVAATVAAEQCTLLQGHGVEHFHFYTLNRAELTLAVCHMLGLRAAATADADAAPAIAAQAIAAE